MKYSLPNFARILALTLLLLAAANGAGQGTVPNPLAPDPSQSLAAQSARRVLAETGIEAKVRHRVSFAGHELSGLGLYQQFGNGPEKMIRWEMKTQLDEHPVTLQQIAGERYFWIRKDLPGDKQQLARVNLWQFRDAVRRVAGNNPQHAANSWLLLGGLSRLMEELDRGFNFTPPQEGMLGAVPVWIVEGTWKPETRVMLDVPAERRSPHFPDRVVLTLGRDNILPLFPYRIEYFRTASPVKSAESTGAGQGSGTEEPLMTMELYEVRRRTDLDARSFDYNPGDQEVEDITRAYLLRLGLAPAG